MNVHYALIYVLKIHQSVIKNQISTQIYVHFIIKCFTKVRISCNESSHLCLGKYARGIRA